MSLKQRMRAESIEHLKAGNKLELTTLRNVLGEIETREKSGKTPVELDDTQVEALLRKEVARRRETAITYTGAGLSDRAAAETAEADFLDMYLPKGLTPQEAEAIVAKTLASLAVEGELTIKDMGRVMKAVGVEIAGRFDGKTVSGMVRAALA